MTKYFWKRYIKIIIIQNIITKTIILITKIKKNFLNYLFEYLILITKIIL